jgi:hypothetical protein
MRAVFLKITYIKNEQNRKHTEWTLTMLKKQQSRLSQNAGWREIRKTAWQLARHAQKLLPWQKVHRCSSESKQTEVHITFQNTGVVTSTLKVLLVNIWQAQSSKYCSYCTYPRTQLSPVQRRYEANIKISHWLGVNIILWSLDILI